VTLPSSVDGHPHDLGVSPIVERSCEEPTTLRRGFSDDLDGSNLLVADCHIHVMNQEVAASEDLIGVCALHRYGRIADDMTVGGPLTRDVPEPLMFPIRVVVHVLASSRCRRGPVRCQTACAMVRPSDVGPRRKSSAQCEHMRSCSWPGADAC